MSEEFLSHHGIKDQKWYRRRFQNEDGSLTPAGRERYGEWHPGKRKPTKLTVSKENGGQKKYNIESEDGKAVGSITTTHQSDDALRVNWINVDKEHKREGYGTSAMDTLIEDAKKNGYKKVTVVIPTDSKDVQHMYERMGFNISKEGLTMDEVADSITTLGNVVKLEYDLEHSDIDGKEVKVHEPNNASEELDHWVDNLLDEVKHIDENGDYLEHYGKGHDDNPPGRGSGRYAFGSGERPFQHDPARRKLASSSGNIVRRPKSGGLFSTLRKTPSETDNSEAAKEARAEAAAKEIIRIAKEHGGWASPSEYKNVSVLQDLAKDKTIVEARKRMEESDPEYPKYLADWEHYAKMAAHVDWKLNKGLYENSTMTVKDNEDWFLYDDGDQGDYNSFVCYLIDQRGLNSSEINEYGGKALKAHKEYEDAIEKVVKDYFGKYGNEKPDPKWWSSVSDIARDAIYKNELGESHYGWMNADLSKKGIEQFAEAKAEIDKFNEESKALNPRYPWSKQPKKLDGESRPAAPRGSGLKTGILDRLRKNRTEATKELAKTAEAKEQERQIKEAQAKAEAAKKKRLEALAKAREVRKANIDKAAAEKAAKEAEEKRINDAIESGDPDKISKIMSKLSNEQQRDAITRINQTAQINSLAAQQRKAMADAEAARKAAEEAIKEANRPRTKAEIREQKFNEALAKVSKAADKLDKVRDSGEKFIKFYNLAAGVNNAFNDKIKLPKIDLGGGQKKDGDKNKDENKDKKDKQQNQNNGSNNQNKDKQQNQSNGDTYNTTRDSYNTYNTYNDYRWTAFTEEFFRAYNAQPNRQTWEAYQEQGNQLLEDFSKRKK